jgi:hypothetical protein
MLCKLHELCANQKALVAYPKGHVHHENKMEVEAVMEMQRHLDETGVQ